MEPTTTVLQRPFSFPAFRPGQAEGAEHVAHGQDALVVMPTASDRSL